jgi:hypothetical protein
MKGTRMIEGREYLLGGRTTDKDKASAERRQLLKEWERVRIIKLCLVDYMLYVHGRKG